MPVTADYIELGVNIIRILLAVGALCFAAYTDWIKREVEDEVWMIMEAAGLVLLVVNFIFWGSSFWHYLFLLPIFTACAYAFWGAPEPSEILKGSKEDIVWGVIYLASIIVILLYIYFNIIKAWNDGGISDETRMLVPMLIVILMFYAMYYVSLGGIHLLHGGADAKGMIAISVLVPLYPVLWSLPLGNAMGDAYLDLFVPFSFSVLMNAAWIPVVFYLFYFPIRNVTQGSLSPYMFFGYKMDIDHVGGSHVWLMQRCDKDKVQKIVLFPSKLDDGKKDIKRLKTMGIDRVWVSPKIPFMIPMLLSVIIMVIFGNLLVELMWFINLLIRGG